MGDLRWSSRCRPRLAARRCESNDSRKSSWTSTNSFRVASASTRGNRSTSVGTSTMVASRSRRISPSTNGSKFSKGFSVAKKTVRKKRNPQDATMRNVRASNKQLEAVATVLKNMNTLLRLQSDHLNDLSAALVVMDERFVKLTAA